MVVKVKVQFGAQKIGGLRYTGDRKRGRNFGDLLCMGTAKEVCGSRFRSSCSIQIRRDWDYRALRAWV